MTTATPPLGWNSWDCFGGSVTEAETLANAEFMAEHLLEFGWDTIVVDIQWYEPEPGFTDYAPVSRAVLDANGRPQPAVGRFPSAADGAGFTELAETIEVLHRGWNIDGTSVRPDHRMVAHTGFLSHARLLPNE